MPKIKISENVTKITTPCFKRLYRIYENNTGKAVADYITVHDEQPDFTKPLTLFDPQYTWKKKIVTDYTARELMVPIFKAGKLVYETPPVEEIRAYCQQELELQWDEVKRFENPHNYYVDLSQKLWDIKHTLLDENG